MSLAMQGACVACHAAGNKPYFQSLEAFENGLVWNPKYVTPDNPDQSYLIALLEGRGTGTYPQMPQGQLYQATVTAKLSRISLDEIKQWVREMPAAPTDATPSASAFSVRRLTAEEMVFALMDQLGLEVGDFAANPDLSGNSGRLSFRYETLAVARTSPTCSCECWVKRRRRRRSTASTTTSTCPPKQSKTPPPRGWRCAPASCANRSG